MLLNVLLFLKAAIAGCAGLAARIVVFGGGVFYVKDHAGHDISLWWFAFIFVAWLLALLADQATNHLTKLLLRVR